MKPWFKQALLAAFVVVGLFVVFVLVERLRGSWRLSQHLAALESRGENLSVVALEPKRPPADQNVLSALMAASNRFSTAMLDRSAHPPLMRYVAPGRGVVMARIRQWTDYSAGPNDWTRLRREVQEASELLAEVRAAADRPAFDSGFDYWKGLTACPLRGDSLVKQAVRFLSLATLLHLHDGRLDEAHDHLCVLVKLGVKPTTEPLIISQLVGYSCLAIAFDVTWQALQVSGWTEAQLAALQSVWNKCDLLGDLGRAFEMSRALSLDFYRQMGASSTVLNDVVAQRERFETSNRAFLLPTNGVWFRCLHLPLWRMAWFQQDACRRLQQWNIMVERERLARIQSWSALPGRPIPGRTFEPLSWARCFDGREKLGRYDRWRYLFSAMNGLGNESVLLKAHLLQSMQQIVLTAMAVERYRLEHGIEPPHLEALVPRFLPALPRDGLSGESLRYRARPDGGFLLYSVGLDGRDDGGDSFPGNPENEFRTIGDGRDVVWPSAAPEWQAEAAMNPS